MRRYGPFVVKTVRSGRVGVGPLLRDWRQRRGISQGNLAQRAEVSMRHLSCVETGKAKPSREMVLHLAAQLDVPNRERNALLLAAGYAPTYPDTNLDDSTLEPIRSALERLLAGHDPYPAIVLDRHWTVVARNRSASILVEGVDPILLSPPVNALRLVLHPGGLGARITNLSEWSGYLLRRLERQITLTSDPALVELDREIRSWPGVSREAVADPDTPFITLRIMSGDDELQLLNLIARFDTALALIPAELVIEAFYPANEATAAALNARVAHR
jgi:transcriptional regulator with XRE-family HTH domain